MSDRPTQLIGGRWVPAIPLPYYLHFRMRCGCGRKFWTHEGYEGHYALVHILRAVAGREHA